MKRYGIIRLDDMDRPAVLWSYPFGSDPDPAERRSPGNMHLIWDRLSHGIRERILNPGLHPKAYLKKISVLLCSSFRVQLAVLFCIVALYATADVIFQGQISLVYAALPVIATGVLFGFRAGMIMTSLVIAFHLSPRVMYGDFEWHDLIDPEGGVYYALLILIGGMVGRISDINQRLNKKIIETQQTEIALRIYQMRLRALVSRISLDEERERRRLSMEILNRLDRTFDLVKKTMNTSGQQSTATDPIAQRTRQVLDQAFRETRIPVLFLSPAVLYTAGLEAAVGWLCLQMQQKYGIRITCTHETTYGSMEEDLRVLLYQAVRELVFNACTHAQASVVTLSLRQEGDELHIVVADNGQGFDTASLEGRPYSDEGFGIFSIKERISYLGGTVAIVSRPGEGTQVTIRMPLGKERTEEAGVRA